MSVWFAVFVMVWIPVISIACMVMGAYIMYCKQENVSPVEQLASYFYQPKEPKPKEDPPGFYD